MAKKRGKLIVIEGTDFSGKRTQAKALLNRLRKEELPCEIMSFPRYNTPTGRIVGQAYLGKEAEYWKGDSNWFGHADDLDPKIASLYYAADRRAAVPEILKIINSKTNLILDRYYTSNMAHQGGKIRNPQQRLKMFKWIEKLELELLELPKEDVTFFLYLPVEVSSILKREGEIADGHESNIEHLRRATETYVQLADLYGWKKINCAPNGTKESLKTIEEIHEEIYNHAIKIINS